MTHAAQMNAALIFLVFLTLLLVAFVGAVIVAPSAPPGSGSPEAPAGEAPPPPGVEAATPLAHVPVPPAPLPRRRPLTTATAAGTTHWSDADVATDILRPVYNEVRRPEVSGSPPWGPAPRPPGPDPWAAENPSPRWGQWPDEGPVPPLRGRPNSSTPPPGRRAPAGIQARYPRHSRGR
jgi:hypothetical protein